MRLVSSKFFFLFVLLAAFVGCNVGCSGATNQFPTRYANNQYNVHHMLNSVVALVRPSVDGTEQRTYCTGFFVSPTRLATAAHCIVRTEDSLAEVLTGVRPNFIGRPVTYTTYQRLTQHQRRPNENMPLAVYEATVVAIDVAHDSALLTLSPNMPASVDWLPINLSVTSVQIGNPVYTVGHPTGIGWILSEGIVSELIRVRELNGDVIIASAHIYFGNSGGPLIDNHGRVIGIVVGMIHRQAYLGIHIPVDHLFALMYPAPQQVRH